MTEAILESISAGDVIATALDYAEQHALEDYVMLDDERMIVRQRKAGGGEEWREFDCSDPHREHPRRSKGKISLHDAESFVTAVKERGTATVYADEEAMALVAVLNDDTTDTPGWRDYRAELVLRRTPEWKAWLDGQDLGDQERFAERIEDGQPEIVNPPAAVVLELAQHFHAATAVDFKSAQRLADGQTQLVYVENVQATAGKSGDIKIPETFDLVVRPFIGADLFKITARLRYRVRGGKLQIGYTLVRPEAVERDAFNDVVFKALAGLDGTTFLAGPAPAQAS